MEDVMPEMRNTTVSVPMTVTPPISTINFVFGEKTEIQPDHPTVTQTTPVSMTFPPSFINLAAKASVGLYDFAPTASKFKPRHPNSDISFFTILKFREAQG